MTPIYLHGFLPLHCFEELPGDSTASRDHYPVVVGQQLRGLRRALVARGDEVSFDDCYAGCRRLLAQQSHDAESFAGTAYTLRWAADFHKNNELLYAQFTEQRRVLEVADAERALDAPLLERGADLVSRAVSAFASADLLHLLRRRAADRRSARGLFHAAREIVVQASLPHHQARLGRAGLSSELLAELERITGELHDLVGARIDQQEAARVQLLPLRLMRAAMVAEATRLCRAAPAVLSPDRAALYLVGRLFGTASRRGRREPEPTPPEARPTQPGTGTSTGTTDSGCPASDCAAPPTGAAAGGTPLPSLVPGAVLATLPAAGGPPLCAVVQPDRSIAWVPVGPAPRRRGGRTRARGGR